jgi:hypothetical protein
MVRQAGSDNKAWKWLVGTSTTNILNTATQTGYRVFDFQPYPSGFTTVYSAVMIDNLDRRTDGWRTSWSPRSGPPGWPAATTATA